MGMALADGSWRGGHARLRSRRYAGGRLGDRWGRGGPQRCLFARAIGQALVRDVEAPSGVCGPLNLVQHRDRQVGG
jgi:hypothetical protein